MGTLHSVTITITPTSQSRVTIPLLLVLVCCCLSFKRILIFYVLLSYVSICVVCIHYRCIITSGTGKACRNEEDSVFIILHSEHTQVYR